MEDKVLDDVFLHREAAKNDPEQRVVGSRAAGLDRLVSGEFAPRIWDLSM